MDRARLAELRDLYRSALLDDVVPFWERHGVDREQGGFFTCLDRGGQLYSTDKAVWFQGRATWLWATLHERVERRPEWLALARHGYEFLERCCFDERGKMYFLLARDGRPLRMRRYVFSEVFAALAYAALARATGDGAVRRRAQELFERLVHALRTPGVIEPKVNPQVRPMKGLSPVMCLLNVADALRPVGDAGRCERIVDECIAEIFRDFVRDAERCVLEVVAPDGRPIDAPEGRVMNPGHVLECAWFILDVARRRAAAGGAAGDGQGRAAGGSPGGAAAGGPQVGLPEGGLVGGACRMIDYALERGWDGRHGGLLYFVDVAGRPATQLEHDMKLWWPHDEALIATLLAWRLTGTARYAEWFERIHAWTFGHFPDPECGEWYGYLHRDGSVSTPLKGGIWKGPFHVPRALLVCWELLAECA